MKKNEWTIMVYMAGDNNLAVDMAYAMEQIKGVAVEGAPNPNLFVYYDGNSPSIPTLYCDFSDPDKPRYVRSCSVPDKLYPVRPKLNENAADTKSVLNFVDWCVNRVPVEEESGEISYGRPAKRYALIFSGHSLGFQDIGLFLDESSGKSMKMKDLYFVLLRLTSGRKLLTELAELEELEDDELARRTSVILGQPLDILGFDSCVMGMLEVGYQFDSIAKTMIVSEGSVPNAGWTYGKILGCLTRGNYRKKPTSYIAEHFVRDFVESQDSYTVGGVSVDMAAWDTSEVMGLAQSFNRLAAVLIECFEDQNTIIYRQMERAILNAHWKCQSFMYDQNVDLGDFCELLEKECASIEGDLDPIQVPLLSEVREKCREVLSQLQKAVILSGFSGGAYQFCHGVSLFFPWSWEGYQVSRKNYESLWYFEYSKNSKHSGASWADFLKKYLGEVARRPAVRSGDNGAKYIYQSGITFADDFESSSLVSNQMHADKLAGQQGSKLAGQQGSKLAGQQGSKLAGQQGSKLAGQQGSKLAGQQGSKLAGQQGSKLAGQQGSKLAGQQGSKLAGQQGSKLAGQQGSKLAGQQGSKLAGQQGSKLAGQQGSKLAGQQGSKLAGQQGSKLAGQQGSKLAGQQGSKLAGQQGSKLAGQSNAESAGGSTAFFNNLKLFKNVESQWDVSGFSRRPSDYSVDDDSENSEAS